MIGCLAVRGSEVSVANRRVVDVIITAVLLQVKADKDSSNLSRLQLASRGVTQATAAVVASTKSGKSQIEETGERISSTACYSA